MGILAATTAAAAIATHIGSITPTSLDNQLTLLENKGFQIWLNYPLPVPATTFSACYPSQFMSSIVASAAGTTQAAFSPLVCPQGYTTVSTSWPAATNYAACCPSSYGLATNDTAPSTRPAYNGKCYTNLPSGSIIPMTLYGEASLSNTKPFSVTASGMQAYAIPYEGAPAGKAVAPSSVSATTSASSTGPAATHSASAPAQNGSSIRPSSPSPSPTGTSAAVKTGVSIFAIGLALIISLF